MAYSLGNVKPHVASAANYYGVKHGIRTIGGFRSRGSVPNSDHPKGLALDFMINNISNGRAVGDALAADLLASGGAYGVKYVIWYRRINNMDGRGWRSYSGPSPHTDHVHASFNSSGQSAPAPGQGSVIPAGGNPLIPDGVEALADKLGDPATWRKVAWNVTGFSLILLGVILLVASGILGAGKAVAPVAKAAKVAGKVLK